jgi:hypothetical protein
MNFFTNTWLTAILVFAAYSFAARQAWRRATIARKDGATWAERKMLGVSLALLVLALNYQLEFIPHAIAWVKGMAKNHGWYVYRWPMAMLGAQIVFVLLAVGVYKYRPKLLRVPASGWLTRFGITLLAGYFFLRATSIHWVDPWLGIHLGCPRTNPWIQIIAALFVAAGLRFVPTLVSSAASQKSVAAGALPNTPHVVRSH